MDKIYLKATKSTPEIKINPDSGIIEFIGKSYPENTFEFYEPIMEWLDEYFTTSSNKKTIVNFEIIYFNSSSSKLFFDLFDILEEAKDNGHEIEINWIYDIDNENAQEAGEDYQEDFQELNFNLVEKDNL